MAPATWASPVLSRLGCRPRAPNCCSVAPEPASGCAERRRARPAGRPSLASRCHLLPLLVALRGGALRGLVTRGTRTRFLLVTGAAAAAAYQTAFFAAAARAGVAIGTVAP